MSNGRLLPDGSPDDVINGSQRDPSLFGDRVRRRAASRAPRRVRPVAEPPRCAGRARRRGTAAWPRDRRRRDPRANPPRSCWPRSSAARAADRRPVRPDRRHLDRRDPRLRADACPTADRPRRRGRRALRERGPADLRPLADQAAHRRSAGCVDERYDARGLGRALERYLGDARLSDAPTPMLVTAYDIEAARAVLLPLASARGSDAYDWSMRARTPRRRRRPTSSRVTRSASAHSLVDGGVFAINPAMCAYAEVASGRAELARSRSARARRPGRSRYDDASDWGQLEWARPIIDVVFDGVGGHRRLPAREPCWPTATYASSPSSSRAATTRATPPTNMRPQPGRDSADRIVRQLRPTVRVVDLTP